MPASCGRSRGAEWPRSLHACQSGPRGLHHSAPAAGFLELLACALSSFLLILPNTFQGRRYYYPHFKDKKLSQSLGGTARLSNSALQLLCSTHGTQQGPVRQPPCFWEGDMIFQVPRLPYPTSPPPQPCPIFSAIRFPCRVSSLTASSRRLL